MRQRGEIIVWILIGLFVVSAGWGVVYTYKNAITRAERAEAANKQLVQANKEQDDENKRLTAENAKAQKLLAVRAAQRNVADEIERRVNAKLEAIRANPEVRDWASTPVPGPVLDGLRNDPGPDRAKDRKGNPTGKPADRERDRRLAGLDYELGPPRARPGIP